MSSLERRYIAALNGESTLDEMESIAGELHRKSMDTRLADKDREMNYHRLTILKGLIRRARK